MISLKSEDVYRCECQLPSDLKEVMRSRSGEVVVAGGFVRSLLSGRCTDDVDVFVPSAKTAQNLVRNVVDHPGAVRVEKDRVTVFGKRFNVEFIFRWSFEHPEDLVRILDFTVCQAGIWYDSDGKLVGQACDRFYGDLRDRRLVYSCPDRREEGDEGGSFLRLFKYYDEGYRPSAHTLGRLVARVASGVDAISCDLPEGQLGDLVGELLSSSSSRSALDRYLAGGREVLR